MIRKLDLKIIKKNRKVKFLKNIQKKNNNQKMLLQCLCKKNFKNFNNKNKPLKYLAIPNYKQLI